jgi:peptidoglycan/LPS O-acetylase OafA/YrhL
VSLECTRVSLPSFLRFTGGIAAFSFSLYAIHYPILMLLNVMTSSSHIDFTFASLGLNAAFILCCIFISFIFYLLFERHTPAVRIRLRDVIKRRVIANQALRTPTILGFDGPRHATAEDRGKLKPEHPKASRRASMSPR